MLAPLSKLASKKVLRKWGQEQPAAFEDTKSTMSKETLLAFADFNKEFHICTDASECQLGGVIMQDNAPLAWHNRQPADTHKRHATGEQ